MPMGLNEGNIGRSVCPGFGKSTYGALWDLGSLLMARHIICDNFSLKGDNIC